MNTYGQYTYYDFEKATNGCSREEKDKYKTNLSSLTIQYGYYWEENCFGGHKFNIYSQNTNVAIEAFKKK